MSGSAGTPTMTVTKKAKKPSEKTAESTGSATPSTAKSHPFQAEVAKLLHLMVHSVYAEREVFLRELISNAADALDKLRYEALARPELLEGGGDLKITISSDQKAKTLTVADTGIGMSRDEMVDNLGTIARSGTQAFIEKLNAGEGALKLIGQFGIGFYSAFMVAEKVEVISRRAGTGEVSLWTSDGSGTFEVAPYRGTDAPARGAVIRLHLREEAAEFLENWRLEQIVRTYSDHVAHPIMLALGADAARQINSASAVWARPKAEITSDQYKEFFGHVAGIYSDPALTLHYKAEGRIEYTVLLFVPGERPYDLYDPERRGRQKLYVRRVFITEDADLLPGYLRFVRGVIDSEDMPLNISREMLQNNPTVSHIRKSVTNRVLGELKRCAESEPEIYARIWQSFGPVLKEGLYEDLERRDQLFEVVRFRTTHSDAETVSLRDYVSRLKDNQTAIYYLTGEDATKAAMSPQLEGYRARGVEVLLLTDPVDSFWVRTALGFDGKPFRSVTQGAADLESIQAHRSARGRGQRRRGDWSSDRGHEAGIGNGRQGGTPVQSAHRIAGLPGGRRRRARPHAGKASGASEDDCRGGLCCGAGDQSQPSADRRPGRQGQGGRRHRGDRGGDTAAVRPGPCSRRRLACRPAGLRPTTHPTDDHQ
jgi:molecular chaperone HtpG